MSIISGLLKGGLSGLGDTAASIIKTFKADPNLVLQADQKIKELENKAIEIEASLTTAINQEITKRIESENIAISDRWKADMTSDSWMSKNARPLTLLSLLGFLFIIVIIDSLTSVKVQFDVKASYIDLMQMLLITVVAAYFGGRSVEKVSQIKNEVK